MVSYWPGPVGLQYSPKEVCMSVARGMLTRSGRDEVSEDGEVWGVISSTEDKEGVVADSGRLSVG